MVSVQLCSPQSYPQRKGIRLHSDHPFSDSVSVFEGLLGARKQRKQLVFSYIVFNYHKLLHPGQLRIPCHPEFQEIQSVNLAIR